MPLYDIEQLFAYKKSSTCVFLGSGASINNITKKQWTLIKKQDVWAVNNWVYHPFIVPDFYHVETKHYGYDILQKRFEEKIEAYKNTKFIFPRGKRIKFFNGTSKRLCFVVPECMNIYEYEIKSRDPKRKHNPFNANYKIDSCYYTKSYDMSITTIFEILYLFGYKKIILFGVDLINSLYFWTGNDPKYGKVHHQTNKSHEGKNSNDPHATYKIKDFIIDFNERWMKPVGREIFIGHKKTLLYPDLRLDSLRK